MARFTARIPKEDVELIRDQLQAAGEVVKIELQEVDQDGKPIEWITTFELAEGE